MSVPDCVVCVCVCSDGPACGQLGVFSDVLRPALCLSSAVSLHHAERGGPRVKPKEQINVNAPDAKINRDARPGCPTAVSYGFAA